MKKTSNIQFIGKQKITKTFKKTLGKKTLVIVEAVSREMLRCGTVVVVGDKFITDKPYAELLKKTYNFIIY